jgi:hypothetical protein
LSVRALILIDLSHGFVAELGQLPTSHPVTHIRRFLQRSRQVAALMQQHQQQQRSPYISPVASLGATSVPSSAVTTSAAEALAIPRSFSLPVHTSALSEPPSVSFPLANGYTTAPAQQSPKLIKNATEVVFVWDQAASA